MFKLAVTAKIYKPPLGKCRRRRCGDRRPSDQQDEPAEQSPERKKQPRQSCCRAAPVL